MFKEKDKEREANIQFANKYGISIKNLDQAAQEAYDSYDPEDFASDDARWGRALRRARNSYRRIANSLKDAQEGMIVCRLRDSDFNRKQYNDALKTAQNNNLSLINEEEKKEKKRLHILKY